MKATTAADLPPLNSGPGPEPFVGTAAEAAGLALREVEHLKARVAALEAALSKK